MNDLLTRFRGVCFLLALILLIVLAAMFLFVLLLFTGLPVWLSFTISFAAFVGGEWKLLKGLGV
jgi:hypothetical protein